MSFYETEIEDFGALLATVEIEYEVVAGEAEVRYLPDGGGYPGSDPYIEILDVRVTSVGGEDWDMDRLALEEMGGDGSWAEWLDDQYFDHINTLIDLSEWVVDHLYKTAEEEW